MKPKKKIKITDALVKAAYDHGQKVARRFAPPGYYARTAAQAGFRAIVKYAVTHL